MDVELGIIEGFYGEPWSPREREETVGFLAERGYRFYLYAPKGDPWLRRRWREAHPDSKTRELESLARVCRKHGARFGVGLSPYEVYRDFDDEARAALARKLSLLDGLRVRDLAILFDDMRGDQPDLAARQAAVVDWIAARTGAGRVLVCPTYYSDDPALDRAFGDRPTGYLEDLGKALDPSVQIFWTGPEVVSREISTGHLERVADLLGRRPFLWDNYPVNDGPRMSRHLHLRAVTGRPAAIASRVAGHGINPALQPVLSRIPALTLLESYRRGEAYEYGEAFRRAATEVLGEELGRLVVEDLVALQDEGLDHLGPRAGGLRERYQAVDHPAAREIVAWLDGAYRVTAETVRAQ